MKNIYRGTVLVTLFICLTFGTLVSGYGQESHTFTVEEIFQNFKKAYEKSENFSAEFVETTLFANRENVARGRFIFGKPNLLRKEYLDRKDDSKIIQLTVLDGEYGWTYTPLLNQINKMRLNQSTRNELLPGIGQSLEDVPKNYDMALIPDDIANRRGVHQIRLIPKPHLVRPATSQTAIGITQETVEIWLKAGEWLPVQFGYKTEFDDGSTQSVIVALKKIERNKKLAPEFFTFVAPKDAEIIELSDE